MSHKTGGTLRLRNQAQVILWTGAPGQGGGISGQISDGRWENSRPQNHWIPWCSANVVVAASEAHLGRNFYAPRDGYCFTEKDLLSIVGGEWLAVVQQQVNPGYTWKDMLTDLRDIRKIIKMVTNLPNAQLDAAGDPVPPAKAPEPPEPEFESYYDTEPASPEPPGKVMVPVNLGQQVQCKHYCDGSMHADSNGNIHGTCNHCGASVTLVHVPTWVAK